jgi:hypothetical protein
MFFMKPAVRAFSTDATADALTRRDFWPWAALWLLFSAIYMATAQRGIGWSDNGFDSWRILRGDLVGSMGLAQAHPAAVALGWLAWRLPIGDPWWRINAFGAPAMALAVANVALLVRLLSGRWSGAIAAACLLGAAHLPWFEATSAKCVHAFSACCLTLELLALWRLTRRPDWRWLALLGLAVGIHWSFHNFALLTLPVYAVVVGGLLWRRQLPVWAALAALAACALGAAPLLALTARMALSDSGGWLAAGASLLFGQHRAAVLGQTWHPEWLRWNAALLGLSLWNPLWLGVIAGVAAAWRYAPPCFGRALLAALALHAAFVARYTVIDQATFALPTLTLLALLAGWGWETLIGRSPARGAAVVGAAGPAPHRAASRSAARRRESSASSPFGESRTSSAPAIASGR